MAINNQCSRAPLPSAVWKLRILETSQISQDQKNLRQNLNIIFPPENIVHILLFGESLVKVFSWCARKKTEIFCPGTRWRHPSRGRWEGPGGCRFRNGDRLCLNADLVALFVNGLGPVWEMHIHQGKRKND